MTCSKQSVSSGLAQRSRIIFASSWLNIAVNLLLSGIKIVIGISTSSIAIVSEGINNASDMATSLLTMIGTKLAAKRPTRKHPFGYGRIEYMTGLVIGILILLTGIEILKSSVHLVLRPEELKIDKIALVILIFSLGIKLAMGLYLIAQGKKVQSKALVAVGEESRSDSIVSAITILSSLCFLVFHISLDAWAGIITSFFVLKTAWDVLSDTVGALLGQPVEKELADQLFSLIRATDGVVNAVDMRLHNYGPNSYTGSVNLEIDHQKTIGEVYEIIHALQLEIMYKYNVTMVFGMYAINNDESRIHSIRKDLAEFVRNTPHLISWHALYLSSDQRHLYCDFIVDYELKDWEKLRQDFLSYMHGIYPQFEVILTIETEYV